MNITFRILKLWGSRMNIDLTARNVGHDPNVRKWIRRNYGPRVLLQFDRLREIPEHSKDELLDLVQLADEAANAGELAELDLLSNAPCDSGEIHEELLNDDGWHAV